MKKVIAVMSCLFILGCAKSNHDENQNADREIYKVEKANSVEEQNNYTDENIAKGIDEIEYEEDIARLLVVNEPY